MADGDGNLTGNLTLTRRPEQTIKLFTTDGVIEIKITKVIDNKAKIRISAPAHVKILRGEISEYTRECSGRDSGKTESD